VCTGICYCCRTRMPCTGICYCCRTRMPCSGICYYWYKKCRVHVPRKSPCLNQVRPFFLSAAPGTAQPTGEKSQSEESTYSYGASSKLSGKISHCFKSVVAQAIYSNLFISTYKLYNLNYS
jgi:hypothetical protein